jgi:uncharacterized protein YkwD
MSLGTRIAILFAAMSLLTPAALFARPPQTTSAEGQLFYSVNRERAAQGLSALQWDDALASAARDHASQMALHNLMSHQLVGEPELLARASAAGARSARTPLQSTPRGCTLPAIAQIYSVPDSAP